MGFRAITIADRVEKRVVERGLNYIGRVKVVKVESGFIEARVYGTEVYTTSIRKQGNEYIDDCNCPYRPTCKHTVALAYLIARDDNLRRELEGEKGYEPEYRKVRNLGKVRNPKVWELPGWLDRQDHEKGVEPRKRKGANLPLLSWLEGLEKGVEIKQVKDNDGGVYFVIDIYKSEQWEYIQEEQKSGEYLIVKVGRYQRIKSSGEVRFNNFQSARGMLSRNPNYLTDLDRQMLRILDYEHDYNNYGWRGDHAVKLTNYSIHRFLNLVIKKDFVFFEKPGNLAKIYPESVKFVLKGRVEKGVLKWKPELKFKDNLVSKTKVKHVLFYDPVVLITEDERIFQLSNKAKASVIEKMVKSPELDEQEIFKTRMFKSLARLSNYLPLELPESWFKNIKTGQPKTIFNLDTSSLFWRVDIGFKYGDEGVGSRDLKKKMLVVEIVENKFGLVKRDFKREKEVLKIAGEILKLKKGIKFPIDLDYAFNLDFLNKLPEDWEIWLRGDRKPIVRSKPKFEIKTSSGIDWLDIKGQVNFDEKAVSLASLLEGVMPGSPFVKVKGEQYFLGKEWLDKIRRLKRLQNEKTGAIRFKSTDVGVLESLTDIIDEDKLTKDWKKRIKKMRNFSKINKVGLAKNLKANLRDYQKDGVSWLYFLREFGFGGILADDMGLGKTVQALAVLADGYEKLKKPRLSLIVAPTSVVYNWKLEMEKFTPFLRSSIYAGPDRKLPKKSEAEIVITSYALLRRDVEKLKNRRWHYLVLDESQSIKNQATKVNKAARSLKADYRLALTGTPIENNLTDLWSQMAVLNPGMLGSLKEFKDEFVKPIEKNEDKETEDYLKRLIKPFVLKRDKQEVLKELPKKFEQINWCVMDEEQRKLYEAIKSYYQVKIFKILDDQGVKKSQIQVLEALLRLRQVCCHPKLLKLGERKDAFKLPKYIREAKVSVKLEAVLELVKTALEEGHKLLIFSQFTSMLSILEDELNEQGLKFLILTGKTRGVDRQKMIDLFQKTNKFPIFLLSLKAGGLGLNLTKADYVIHYDPWWNPAVERQATDRAHRIGQENKVHVYKMLVKDSIEEKILKLQEKKKGLIENFISSAGKGKGLTKKDIEFLLR
ncbi:DEAD/DEAH box helicase [Patescibacteria group bacterium]|nr:DEAD/DEAH box helicase [Patescibacteria group bacterium]